jgi:hypothetical protein
MLLSPCLTALLTPAAASATGDSTADVPADIQIHSNDEYVAKFGVQRAIAEGVPLPSDTAINAPCNGEADREFAGHGPSMTEWSRAAAVSA